MVCEKVTLSRIFFFLNFQAVLNMLDDDPARMQQIRKFSAIYGRFDCKRRPEKPLTLHEVGYVCE